MFKWISQWANKTFPESAPEDIVFSKANISEPVHAILKAWKQNPKRFKFESKTDVIALVNAPYYRTPNWDISVKDTETDVVLDFDVILENESWKDVNMNYYDVIFKRKVFQHKIYPVLGSKVNLKPAWMTQDEVDYIVRSVTPYYLKRVNRYRDIVESRIDRSRKASQLKSEIAKQKERQRLCEIYK
jgi:hypothetical protein